MIRQIGFDRKKQHDFIGGTNFGLKRIEGNNFLNAKI
jgi:hypothetical protein